MNKCVFALVLVMALLSVGCSRKNNAQIPFNENEILKISVFKSGEIKADGKMVSQKDLDILLATNAQRNGVIWYYREAGQEEPPPQAMEALHLIIKHKRPISMSSKPDFSDTIDEKGNSIPR